MSNLWTVPDVLRNLRDGEISLGRALELIRPFLAASTETHDEAWDCADCPAIFQRGAGWFDPAKGIVCPACKSTRVGPVRAAS